MSQSSITWHTASRLHRAMMSHGEAQLFDARTGAMITARECNVYATNFYGLDDSRITVKFLQEHKYGSPEILRIMDIRQRLIEFSKEHCGTSG